MDEQREREENRKWDKGTKRNWQKKKEKKSKPGIERERSEAERMNLKQQINKQTDLGELLNSQPQKKTRVNKNVCIG